MKEISWNDIVRVRVMLDDKEYIPGIWSDKAQRLANSLQRQGMAFTSSSVAMGLSDSSTSFNVTCRGGVRDIVILHALVYGIE